MMNRRYLLLALAATVGLGCESHSTPTSMKATAATKAIAATQPTAAVPTDVDGLLKAMTPEEKLSLIHANSKFTTAAIPRLNIPVRWLSDGPHGVREDVGPMSWNPAGRTDDFITAMPNALCLAATFDPDLARKYGETVGEEARARHKDIMLGPSINIQRTPLCGRNFEYMGEDPQLTSEMAVAYIQGLQSRDVACSVKHFALNNQEDHRGSIDVHVDDRTLHEIYLAGFEAAVKQGGALTVMAAYNKFRGAYCAENDLLLNQILKKEWGFKGLVVSDWSAVHTTQGAAEGGMDLEMGSDTGQRTYDEFFLANPFMKMIQSGALPMSLLDEKARRNLYVMVQTHVLDPAHRFVGSQNTPQHQRTARSIAEAGMVLLKNENSVLPLDPKKTKTIAVIGDFASRPILSGGGSAGLKSFYEITPLQGIIQRVGPAANVVFAQGMALPTQQRRRPATQYDAAGMRVEATQPSTAAAAATVPAANELLERAVAAAKSAEVAIVVVGVGHGRGHDEEGADRKDMKLPYGQDDLVDAVSKANPKTVVVLVSGGAIEMPWLPQTPGVLQMWYGGLEGGNALAEVLFGDVAPGGKLPCTFPKKLDDSPAHAMGNYPGNVVENYAEGVFVGYRWFDEKKIEPLFPFGFGLSYTTFKYANLKVEADDSSAGPKLAVSFDITNTGSRPGSEIGQVYVHEEHAQVPRPPQELKGFAKVVLKPGETQHVKVALPPRALAYYDEASKGWVAQPGTFEIRVGGGSREIQATGSYELKQKVSVE